MSRLCLALLLACLGGVSARADLVYVLNSGDASVTVYDTVRREEVRRIPVLREAHHLLLSPDRRSLIIADSGGNEFIYLDPNTAQVTRRERISNPYHLEYSPDGRLLVITSLRRDQVDIYDAANNTLLQRLRVPDKPSHLAYSPDGHYAYVTLQGARGLLAIDLHERKPLWATEVGPQPAGVTWHRGRLLVGVMGSDYLAVVNPADGRVERSIPIARGVHTVFPAPDGRALYVNSRVESRITVLDPETLEVTARWDIPGGPDCIAFDAAGRLWVTLRWTARVAVIDPRTGVTEYIPVGRSPHGIFVQPRETALDATVPLITAAPGPVMVAAGAPRPPGEPPLAESYEEPRRLPRALPGGGPPGHPGVTDAALRPGTNPAHGAVIQGTARVAGSPADTRSWWRRWLAR
jgi:DNA-binding beta-propeller fold protein YncE